MGVKSESGEPFSAHVLIFLHVARENSFSPEVLENNKIVEDSSQRKISYEMNFYFKK